MIYQKSTRAGQYLTQVTGYRAFVPRPLPPDPPLNIDAEMLSVLSKADQALGRLYASADMLPNPNMFVSMYVRKEAVLSSQIEGTQASLDDLLEYEAARPNEPLVRDVFEVVNYVRAMNHGLDRLETLPLSNRLLREIHQELLTGVRGENKSPGEFRRTQNWIGSSSGSINDALYVPPPRHEMESAMGLLESYLHSPDITPVIIKAGLIHAQFETIHPFSDCNGRVGRLLITFYLCAQRVLNRPLLYLSAYFKHYRQVYYERLQEVRDLGKWEEWIKFFLEAVAHVAREAASTARAIIHMREEFSNLIQEQLRNSSSGLHLLDLLYEEPYLTVNRAMIGLNVSYPTASRLLNSFIEYGIVQEITGQSRYRVFRYGQYIDLLQRDIGSA